MADEIDDILNKSFDELQEDKLLPRGTWVLQMRNAVYFPPREEGKSGRVVFFYKVIEPSDDVDMDEIAALGDDYDYTQNEVSHQEFVDGERDWKKVKTHLKRHKGVDWDGTILDVLKKGSRGAEIQAELDEEVFENSFGETQRRNKASRFRGLD